MIRIRNLTTERAKRNRYARLTRMPVAEQANADTDDLNDNEDTEDEDDDDGDTDAEGEGG